jgi:hypothetical protein
MSEIKHPAHLEEEKNPIAELQNVWERYGKQASYVLLAIIVIVAGFFAYRNLVSEPNEKKLPKPCSGPNSIIAWIRPGWR